MRSIGEWVRDTVEYGVEVRAKFKVEDISRLLIGGTETSSIITFNLCNALLCFSHRQGKRSSDFLDSDDGSFRERTSNFDC